jgi:hypothetical protein
MKRVKQSSNAIRDLHAGRNSELDSNSVRPYGRHGVGTFTGHPVGLVVVIGVIIMAMMKLPPARLFFAAAILVGGVFGLFLWLRSRNRGF